MALAICLSIFFPGAGHLCIGEVGKGIAILIVSLCLLCSIVGAPFLLLVMIYCVVDVIATVRHNEAVATWNWQLQQVAKADADRKHNELVQAVRTSRRHPNDVILPD